MSLRKRIPGATFGQTSLAAIIALMAATVLFMGRPAATSAAGTGTIEVNLYDSSGAELALPGDHAWYQINTGSILYIPGGTGTDREVEVPANTNVTVWVAWHATASHKVTLQVEEGETEVVNFYTTNVTIHYPGQVAYGGPAGNSTWFKNTAAPASQELLSDGSNPTVFRLHTPSGLARTEVQWPIATGTGKTAVFTMHAIRVLANDGSPIEGVGASKLTSPGYHVSQVSNPDATNSEGFLAWARPGVVTSTDITVRVNGTSGVQSWDPTAVPLAVFQTTNVTLKYWPGLISRARYFFNDNNALWFDAQSLEMFAGDYPIQFRSTGTTANPGTLYTQTTLSVPEPAQGPITRTAVIVRLQDSEGNGLTGTASYYLGSWHNSAVETSHTVPANIPSGFNVHTQPQYPGSGIVLLDGAPTNMTFAMTYKGSRQQLPKQNVQSDSKAYFATVAASVHLEDSNGSPLQGGDVSYYTNGWYTDMADTDANGDSTIELLPSKVTFAVSWKGSRQQKTANNIGATPVTTFATVPVTVHLQDSNGSPLPDGDVSYYTNGWYTDMADTDANGDSTIELLPSKATFAVVYLGSRQQKTVNDISAGGASPVLFETGLVVSGTGTATSFYTNSWRTFPGGGVELLPSKVSFRFNDGTPQLTLPTITPGEENQIH